jgi:hypothetical protein
LELYHFPTATDVSCHAIANYLPHLHTLNVNDLQGVTDIGVSAVRSACVKLTTLDISSCYNVRGGGLALGPSGVLEHLTLSSIGTPTEENLISCAQHNYNLCTLEILLHKNAHTPDLPSTALSRSVVYLTQLTEFDYQCLGEKENTCVNDELLSALGQYCSMLVKLRLRDGRCITSAGFKALSGLSCLEELTLDHCTQLNNSSTTAIAQGCRNMRKLSVVGCVWVTSPGISAIARCCSKLTYLNISECSWVRDCAILELIRCLPHLGTVIVKDNYLLSAAVKSKRPLYTTW